MLPSETMSPEMREASRVTPDLVHDRVKRHDKRMRQQHPLWGEIRAVVRNEFWDWLRTRLDKKDQSYIDRLTKIEVNRLKKIINSYLASLYPRSIEAQFGADPTSPGDSVKASTVINHLIKRKRVKKRILQCTRLSLTYDYCAMKVGHDPSDGRPALDRVWFRAIPPWELLLDEEVTDEDEARFIGHISDWDIDDIARDYPEVDVDCLATIERSDFLVDSPTKQKGDRDQDPSAAASDGVRDKRRFVRVLELCNLVDHWEDPKSGLLLNGRLEIYLVDQQGKYRDPIFVGPLPYSIPGHPPLPHIMPLIFDSDAEAPLRGIGLARTLMPQQRALNAWRSWVAEKAQKDNPAWLGKKKHFNADNIADFERGKINTVIMVEEGEDENLNLRNDVMVPLDHTRTSADTRAHILDIERDMEVLPQMSPAALTQVTKATFGEIALVEQHSESEFGRHAEARDDWLAMVLQVACAAIAAAQRMTGGVGGDVDADIDEGASAHELARDIQEGAQVRQRIDNEEGPESVVDQPEGTEALSEQVEEETGDDLSEAGVSVVAAMPAFELLDLGANDATDTIRAEPEVMYLEDPNGEVMEIRPEDLEAWWTITFSETGRTPTKDMEQKRALLTTMEQRAALWTASQKGGSEGVMARAELEVMCRLLDLPREVWPEALDARLREQEAKAKDAGGKAAPEGGEQGAEAESGGDAAAILEAAAQRVGQDPIGVAEYLLENGAQAPGLQEALQLPPEQALPLVQQAIDQMAQDLMGGQQA